MARSVGSKAERRSGCEGLMESLRRWLSCNVPQRFVCPIGLGEHPVRILDGKLDFMWVDSKHLDYNVVIDDDSFIRGERKDAHWPTSMG
jgi:hypothetical protein